MFAAIAGAVAGFWVAVPFFLWLGWFGIVPTLAIAATVYYAIEKSP